MKKTQHYFAIIIAICLTWFLCACNTVNQTMIDAGVPSEEQSVLVVLGSNGNWYDVTLAFVDDTPYDATGSIFYIPSGFHTLGISLTTSSFENDYSDPDVVIRTKWTNSGKLKIQTELLPGHTYRMIVNSASDIRIDDISVSVDFPLPKRAPLAPDNGVLTNWALPRGFFFSPGIMNASVYLQYTSLPGKEAKANYFGTGNSFTTIVSEWGSTGMKAFGAGMALQGGVETGFRKFRASLLAELNGGIGFGGETDHAGLLNWGYLFLAEVYHSDFAGIGFGYGKKTAVYPFFGSAIPHGEQQAHKNQFPHFRFEIFLRPGKEVPITFFGDYFFEQKGWSAGIALNLAPKGESPFPKVFLR